MSSSELDTAVPLPESNKLARKNLVLRRRSLSFGLSQHLRKGVSEDRGGPRRRRTPGFFLGGQRTIQGRKDEDFRNFAVFDHFSGKAPSAP
eukprot:gene26136-biopygen14261